MKVTDRILYEKVVSGDRGSHLATEETNRGSRQGLLFKLKKKKRLKDTNKIETT